MSDTKVRLTVTLPGRVPFSKQLCFENNGKPIERMTEIETVVTSYRDKHGKVHRNVTERHVPKRIPARKIINLSQEAYDYMTSAFVPEWFRVKGHLGTNEWHGMSKAKRLERWMVRSAEAAGGVLEKFEVFDE